MVTARKPVVLSGSFAYVPLQVSETASPFSLHGHASHERYTVSSVEGRERNLHRPILRTPRIETWHIPGREGRGNTSE